MLGIALIAAASGSAPAEARPPPRDAPRIEQAPPSRPGQRPAPREDRERPPADDIAISPGQAAAIAASRTGGRVLGVKLQGGKRPRYRVRLLLGGERVRSVTVDAATGEFRG